MRSKSPLALMEQVVMVLVFALAAALCLQVFVFSDQSSHRHNDMDHAVLLAQNTAETLKACGGLEHAAGTLGGEIVQMNWHSYYNKDLSPALDRENAYYCVDTLPENSGIQGLGQATVSVFKSSENEPLFSLTVAWQEVSSHG